jgi:capsular polysaccharide transport system permease protein
MPTPIRLPKRSPWVIQLIVISVLLKREMTNQFGKYALGFVWMIFEPLLSVIFLGVIIGPLIGRSVPEIPYAFFLLFGKMQLNVFSSSMNTGMRSVGVNQALLVYPTVKPLDTFIARYLYEFLTSFFSFVLFCIVAMCLGFDMSLASLDVIIACYLITWLMGCGFGLIFAVGSAYFKEVEKIVKVVTTPLMIISCVLFPLSVLPLDIQQILLANPLVHTIEVSRFAAFPHYPIDGPCLFYPFQFAIVVLAIGLTLFHGNRHYLSQV